MKKRWCSIPDHAAAPAASGGDAGQCGRGGPSRRWWWELTGLEGRTCWGRCCPSRRAPGRTAAFGGETVEDPEKDRALRAMRPLDQMDPEGFTCWTSRRTAPTGNSAGPTTRPTPIRSPSGFQRRTPLAVSAVYHRYAFDSYYRLDLSGLELTPGDRGAGGGAPPAGLPIQGPLCWPWRAGGPHPGGRSCCWRWPSACAPDGR